MSQTWSFLRDQDEYHNTMEIWGQRKKITVLTETVETSTIDVTQEPRTHKEEKYLFHPIVDFLCLGGGSLLLFVLLAIFVPDCDLFALN